MLDMVHVYSNTHRRLLLSVLPSGRLCAQISPYTTVASAIDASAARRLCVEDWQFRYSPLDARSHGLVFCPRCSPHQPLPIIAPIVIVVVVGIRVERVGECAVFLVWCGILG